MNNLKGLYDNEIAEDDLDNAVQAVFEVTRKLNIKPMPEALVFLLAFMESSDRAGLDYHKIMRVVGGAESLHEVTKEGNVQ